MEANSAESAKTKQIMHNDYNVYLPEIGALKAHFYCILKMMQSHISCQPGV